MEIVLIVLEAIASLAMIVVVLLQSGKKAGLSGAIAGGSETYMSKGKSNSFAWTCSTFSRSVLLELNSVSTLR